MNKCPNCGRCEHCGHVPFKVTPWPYTLYPYTTAPNSVPYTGPNYVPYKVTCGGISSGGSGVGSSTASAN